MSPVHESFIGGGANETVLTKSAASEKRRPYGRSRVPEE